MNDVPGVSPGGEWRGPHGVGDEWISFELRMRRRRLTKCLLRAEAALDAGRPDDARAALAEARELDADSSELDALDARLHALTNPAAPNSGSSRRRPPYRRPFVIAGAAGCVLLAAGVLAFGLPDWQRAPSSTAPAGHAGDQTAAVEPAPARLAGQRPQGPEAHSLKVVYETVRVAAATPRLVEDLPPSNPSRPIADAEPAPEAVVLAVNREPAAPPPPPVTPEVRSDLPLETLPNRSVDAPPVRVPAPPADTVVPAASTIEVAAGSVESKPAPVRDESAIVRALLQQYERAYSSLDAEAASAIWPEVNRGALARAFDGLASQRVSLGSCDVDVNGPAARATCSGSATWEPKVGGGLRTEPRRWNFEFRKRGGNWEIARAVTR